LGACGEIIVMMQRIFIVIDFVLKLLDGAGKLYQLD